MKKTVLLDFFRRHHKTSLFVFFWCCGLFLGAIAASFTDPILLSGMRGAASGTVSIPGSFIAAVLPFLLVSYAVLIAKPKWIYCVTFVKAFTFSYIGFLIHITFGSAGWLVRCFLQFCGICAAPVYCWFCIRQISGSGESVRKDLRIVCILMAAIAAVDFILVSPYFIHLTAI